MARDPSEREDLLREATALVERVELTLTDFPEPIVIGFRRNGAGSIYFGGDPVYQFNAQGELRRAYVDRRMLKAERGGLAALERRETAAETQLLRHDLTATETGAFLAAATEHIKQLTDALTAGHFQVVGQVPANGHVIARVAAWLVALPKPPKVAASPATAGRR